ncbi:histidine kinase dimerization/phospho-acceptor domain-containing protein, partial [Intestinimonas timonensis]|uniref:histidine kinase dimerization/phospho-acceptor domain-containing protein n=1 Tax=Intestinimonas timonensis TaxID=1689270 RepID=UPI003A8CF738
MLILLALLVLLCLGLGLRLYALERDIRSCARQLRSGRPRVSMAAPNAAAEELLTAINTLLDLREQEEGDYRRQERAIRQQITNISHDLRTPLTSILGYL